jgi:hypothetical protein
LVEQTGEDSKKWFDLSISMLRAVWAEQRIVFYHVVLGKTKYELESKPVRENPS